MDIPEKIVLSDACGSIPQTIRFARFRLPAGRQGGEPTPVQPPHETEGLRNGVLLQRIKGKRQGIVGFFLNSPSYGLDILCCHSGVDRALHKNLPLTSVHHGSRSPELFLYGAPQSGLHVGLSKGGEQ